MTNMKKVLAGIAALAALGLGGSAIAGAAGDGSPPADGDAAAQATACNQAGIDPNGNVQYDDKTGTCTLDSGRNDESEAGETGSAAEERGEKESAAQERGEDESAEEGNEVREDDGPGGHADEPQNANADHQFEGKE